jgi:charged multivesicular body protein 7
MMKTLALSALFCISAISAQASLGWNDLRVTWGLNPFSQWDFAQVPTNLNGGGDMKDFVQMDNLCTTKGPFFGVRYWVANDPSLILLFDINGYIAGMQTLIPQSEYTPEKGRGANAMTLYNGYYTLTAYFVDPTTVCGPGRTADQFGAQGTGYGLWLQNGTSMVQIPAQETDVANTQWTLGHCFVTMGVHYWYDVSLDMSCGDFFPFFILYNDNKLNAWGFATNYGGGKSQRYEHPPHSAIAGFMNPVPTCFVSDPSFAALSTMHVYLTNNPRTGDLCDLSKYENGKRVRV